MLSFFQAPGTRVVDTSPLEDSVTLMVASNTALPPTPGLGTFTMVSGTHTASEQGDENVESQDFLPDDIISQA
jgi:hypothetical protein